MNTLTIISPDKSFRLLIKLITPFINSSLDYCPITCENNLSGRLFAWLLRKPYSLHNSTSYSSKNSVKPRRLT